MVTPIRPGPNAPRAAVLRHAWGKALDRQMGQRGVTRKELRALLAAEGLEVSLQTISHWRTGKHAPKAEHQAVIARVLMVPPEFLFSVEAAA